MFDAAHIAELVDALSSRLPDLVGHPVPVRRMNGGLVGIELPPESLLTTARFLRDTLGFDLLSCVSGVDMRDHLDSVYHLRALGKNWVLQVRVPLAPDAPEVPSLVGIYPTANWLEREEYDLVGIIYTGHPDLRRIMLDDEFQGHPLLKSFRSTPIVVHDRATTQTSPDQAIGGEQQRNVERVVSKRLGQGQEERLHPGTPTFGDMAIFSRTGQGLMPGQDPHNPMVEEGTTGPGLHPGRRRGGRGDRPTSDQTPRRNGSK
jgi:NADH/F420H2 dehydrogenase subunit C